MTRLLPTKSRWIGPMSGQEALELITREKHSIERWNAMTPDRQHELASTVRAHLVRLGDTVDNWLPAATNVKDNGFLEVVLLLPVHGPQKVVGSPAHTPLDDGVREAVIESLMEND